MTSNMNDMNKRMPFNEPEGYVEALLDKATEKAVHCALAKSARTVQMRVYSAIAAAAVVLVLLGTGLNYFSPQTESQEKHLAVANTAADPLDEFLNEISDEEASMIDCYDIEDIPEY